MTDTEGEKNQNTTNNPTLNLSHLPADVFREGVQCCNLCEPHKVQQGQVQGPALESMQFKHKYRLAREWADSSPEKDNLIWLTRNSS